MCIALVRARVHARALLFAAALAAAGLLSPAAANAADVTVKIDNFTFTPQKLTVKAGDTVTWENVDDIPHTVVATNRSFKSKALDTNDKFSFTFTTPGTIEYFCSLHPHMKASLVVEAATGSAETK
ncbi:MAG: cupredoxin family copper-binding protein [Alphaproteobacteria bacterium]|nr:cupredoxin family copper-binding protein [Alphaproteobacteria bacterium]